jgi:hypothetical protein
VNTETSSQTSVQRSRSAESCGPRALCGWSPPDHAADTPLKRSLDRLVPRTGIGVCLFFAAVAGLLLLAPLFTRRLELGIEGVAALLAGAWCAINLWRCGHAHCVVTSSGWLVLALFTFYEAAIGRSLIAGDEELVFVLILGAGVVFEWAWTAARGTNAVTLGAQ